MTVVKFFWVLTLIASVLGGIGLFFIAISPASAPQQAAGAAIAIGVAVIPYVFTRAVEGLTKK